MSNSLSRTTAHWPGRTLLVAALCAFVVSSACQTQRGETDAAAGNVVIVNAPAAGEVRRVLVHEGQPVDAGAPIVELAVPTAPVAPAQPPGESPQTRAARSAQAAQAEVEAARAEVVRTQVEVQRLTPLVTAGEAAQGQLDGARAVYERAQQHLQQAQTAVQGAQTGLVVATGQPAQVGAPAAPAEQLVLARAPAAGTVRVVSARVGARVTTGQPLATLRTGAR